MKNDSLKHFFDTAKSHHSDIMSRISSLVDNRNTDKVAACTLNTACQFGKWLYNEATLLKEFPSYKKVEVYHNYLHDNLAKLVMEIKKDIPNTIFNRRNKKKQEAYIQVYHQQIQNAAFDMLKALNKLENEVIKHESDSTKASIFKNSSSVDDLAKKKKTKVGKKKLTPEERKVMNEDIKRILGN